jgi:release factor glutamine methyltransferase
MATISEVLSRERATPCGDSWLIDTELLLMEALACRRETLLTWPDREVDADAQQRFDAMIARRRGGEPIAYIVESREFWDFSLTVSPAVLIPRPETELLVETCLELLSARAGAQRVVDLGTGSGAIAIALARADVRFEVVGVELSAEALAIAQTNAERLAGDTLRFVQGSWLDASVCTALGGAVDLIASNPPYIAPGDAHLGRGDLRFEPALALSCAEQGLASILSIVEDCHKVLKKGGWLVLEHGFDQRDAVAAILARAGFAEITCLKDLAGQDRVTRAHYN